MTEDEYVSHDATALAALVQGGKAEPADLAAIALARIARLDPEIGAVVAVDPEGALAAAHAVDRTLRLAGVPVLVKDTNVDVAGFATRHGSRFYADAPVATRDSELVRRLRAAGAIILGRTKTPEFASDFVTEPAFGGPARNPWKLDRASGGSSGGSAAAVAARMAPAAHGTDCGGSIRIPAAACGLVGLKATRGRIPQGPDVGERVSGLNVEGVLTRTVRDTALFLDVLAGSDPGAPYQAPSHEGRWRDIKEVRHLRVGVVTAPPLGGTTAAAIVAAVEATADALAAAGHTIVPWTWPDLAGAAEAATVFWQGEIGELVEARIHTLGREPRADELELVCRRAWQETRARGVLDFLAAKAEQNRISRAVAAAFADIDALLLPATSDFPPPVGLFATLDYDSWCKAAYGYAPFSEIFNMTGQPAISLPVAVSDDGLPIGVQLAGRFGEDALLLSLAQTLEAECGWDQRSPPL